MKILVLSDIHYPFTNKSKIEEIIKKEKPDEVILLGDIIEKEGSDREFFSFMDKLTDKKYYFLRGDEDKVNYGLNSLILKIGGKEFLFFHGNKLQVINDKKTAFLVRIIKNLNINLPLLLFAIAARMRRPFFRGEIVLGHAHALFRFKRLKVTGAGTLTNLKNVYNDKGYLIITDKKIYLKRISPLN